jgi:hypothetical protein
MQDPSIVAGQAVQQHPAELDAVRTNGARMVNLAGDDAGSTWAQLEVFMSRWREIEKLYDEPGPFIYLAHRATSLRRISLTLDAPPVSSSTTTLREAPRRPRRQAPMDPRQTVIPVDEA